MAKLKSSGILLYRRSAAGLEVFLTLHGGPYWAKRDAGAWSIPKGEFDDSETPLAAARREFREETGFSVDGNFFELTPVVQKGGKQVYAFALEGTVDAAAVQSNTFEMEWPPRSGNWQSFPEIGKAAWFLIPAAKEKINPAQIALLDELLEKMTPL